MPFNDGPVIVNPAGIWVESTGIRITVSCNDAQDPGKKKQTQSKKHKKVRFKFRECNIDKRLWVFIPESTLFSKSQRASPLVLLHIINGINDF
jgi:hypothetical protein